MYIIVWLGLACEGEDSKERASKDQARVNDKRQLGHQWTMTMVKKRVLALSLGTNQPMRSHIVRRIKSFLDYLKK